MVKFILLSFILFSLISCGQNKETDIEKKAAIIHNKVLTLDSHTDTPLRFLNDEFDVGKRNDAKTSKIDLPRMKEGGMDAVFFAVFLGQRDRTPEGNAKVIKKTHEIFDAIYEQIEK